MKSHVVCSLTEVRHLVQHGIDPDLFGTFMNDRLNTRKKNIK